MMKGRDTMKENSRKFLKKIGKITEMPKQAQKDLLDLFPLSLELKDKTHIKDNLGNISNPFHPFFRGHYVFSFLFFFPSLNSGPCLISCSFLSLASRVPAVSFLAFLSSTHVSSAHSPSLPLLVLTQGRSLL